MPRRGVAAIALTALALALLLGFQTPSDVLTPPGRSTGPEPGSTGGAIGSAGRTPAPGSADPGNGGTGATGGSDTTGGRTVTGPRIDTRWGPVQVVITLQDQQLVDISALQLPTGGRSGQISRFAEPILRSEALQAQGADIDGVSGATFTSVAYERSLQAALDSAGT